VLVGSHATREKPEINKSFAGFCSLVAAFDNDSDDDKGLNDWICTLYQTRNGAGVLSQQDCIQISTTVARQ
jgi:hypothetical protein